MIWKMVHYRSWSNLQSISSIMNVFFFAESQKTDALQIKGEKLTFDKIERELTLRLMKNAMVAKTPEKVLMDVFGVNRNKVQYLKQLTRARYPEVGKDASAEDGGTDSPTS